MSADRWRALAEEVVGDMDFAIDFTSQEIAEFIESLTAFAAEVEVETRRAERERIVAGLDGVAAPEPVGSPSEDLRYAWQQGCRCGLTIAIGIADPDGKACDAIGYAELIAPTPTGPKEDSDK